MGLCILASSIQVSALPAALSPLKQVMKEKNSFLSALTTGSLYLQRAALGRWKYTKLQIPNSCLNPVGAHLSKGTSIDAVGPEISDFVNLNFENFGIDGSFLVGEVIFTDNFGNVITNIPENIILRFSTFGSQMEVNGRKVSFVQTYGLVGQEEPLALIGSHGFLEIAVNKGSAARQFGLKSGEQVVIKTV